MTSISPMRVRKLRPTIASPRAARKSTASDSARAPSSIARASVRRGVERDESTITIDRELALSYEDMPGAELDMAGRSVERELRRRIRRERSRDPERVEAERIEAIERGARKFSARIVGELRCIGCDEPRQIDEAHIVQVADDGRIGPIEQQPARI